MNISDFLNSTITIDSELINGFKNFLPLITEAVLVLIVIRSTMSFFKRRRKAKENKEKEIADRRQREDQEILKILPPSWRDLAYACDDLNCCSACETLINYHVSHRSNLPPLPPKAVMWFARQIVPYSESGVYSGKDAERIRSIITILIPRTVNYKYPDGESHE